MRYFQFEMAQDETSFHFGTSDMFNVVFVPPSPCGKNPKVKGIFVCLFKNSKFGAESYLMLQMFLFIGGTHLCI